MPFDLMFRHLDSYHQATSSKERLRLLQLAREAQMGRCQPENSRVAIDARLRLAIKRSSAARIGR